MGRQTHNLKAAGSNPAPGMNNRVKGMGTKLDSINSSSERLNNVVQKVDMEKWRSINHFL